MAAALAATALVATIPATSRGSDEPGPAWIRAGEDVRAGFATRIAAQAGRPVAPGIREYTKAFRPAFGQADYYANRIVHYGGDISVDEYNGHIEGTILVDSVISGANHQALDFITLMPVTSVTDVQGQPLEFEAITIQGYPFTEVRLPAAPADGSTVSLVFHLSGKPECSSGGGAVSVQLCGWGKANYIAGMVFLPFSIAEQFATMDLRITVKKGLVVASSGTTVEVLPGPDADHEIQHVVQDFPTDSRSFSIAPYQLSQVPMGEKWLRLFTLNEPGIQAMAGGILSDVRDILAFFGGRYGEFLFPKMEACQITDDAGAAFGWPALLWIPDSMFYQGAGGWGEDADQRAALFAHELAHQWYPDIVKNNDSAAAWLSEGFAEYSSVSYMETRLGADYAAGVFDHYSTLYQYVAAMRPESDYGLTSEASYYVTDGMVYQIVTYYKGATVAHIIEHVVGKDVFLKALLGLYDEMAGKEKYYNTWTLQKRLEAEYGKPLDWLFNEWVYRTGFPIYTVDVVRTTQDGKPVAQVRVRRSSTQKNNVFTMPVRLTLVTTAGDIAHDEYIDQDDMTFTYDLPERLVRLRFDPDRTFIKRAVSGQPGDTDLSGEVDGIDLIYTAWAQGGFLGYSRNFLASADLNGDWSIDGTDLALVMDNFGKTSADGEVTP